MAGLLLKLKTWWQTADKTQKLITLFGGSFLVLLLFGTFLFASKPRMSLVFTNLDPADAGSVAMEVENMGIPCTFDAAGNVQVPSDKVAKVRATLAMNGKLPKGGEHFTSDALDKMNLMSTQAVETQKLNAIKEADLAQSLQVFDGVATATVKITQAVDSPFETEKKPAQANVTISERVGEVVTQGQARAMANLVASAVPGLDKGKVTIFTRTGRPLWDGQDMTSSAASATNKLDLEKAESRKRRDELQEALNRMLGPGNAIAMVDVTLDTSKVHEEVVNNEPSRSPSSIKKIAEEMNSSSKGGEAGATSGFSSNNPAEGEAPRLSTSGGSNANSGYKVTQTAGDYPTNTKVTSTEKGVGELKSMAITILVNKKDGIAVDPNDPNDPIVSLGNSYLGAHATDANNFTSKVVAYPFDTSQALAAKNAEDAASSANRMQQILSILPIAALLIVAFLVVKTLSKMTPRPLGGTPALAGAGAPSLPGGGMVSLEGMTQVRGLEPANRLVLPEVVKQKALEAGITEEQLQAAIEEAGEAGISVEDIPTIKSKVNVPLEQIKKMATERPEAVAMLIKSWLIEEGIRR